MSSVIAGRGGKTGQGQIRIVITVDEKESQKALAMVEVLTNPRYFDMFLRTRAVGYLQKRAAARFASEGDRASGRWQPLSEATINIRDEEGYPPGPINVRAGDLKRAIVNARGRTAMIPEGATLTWPTSGDLVGRRVPEKYAVAQMGSERQTMPKHGPTPARPVVASNQEDLVGLVELLAMELKMALEHGMSITINALSA